MNNNHARDLFHLQSELVDRKVNMAVSNAIDRVVDQITGLKNQMQIEMGSFRTEMHSLNSGVHKEIHALRNEMYVEINGLSNKMHEGMDALRNEMHKGFLALEPRVSAIETKLGMVNETEKEIRAKILDTEKKVRNNFIDYIFKAGWFLLTSVGLYVLYQSLFLIIK